MRKGAFTRGPVAIYGGNLISSVYTASDVAVFGCNMLEWESEYKDIESQSNASLIITAFNAATACEDMGYDGEACVKALPELIAALDDRYTIDDVRGFCKSVLTKCRG